MEDFVTLFDHKFLPQGLALYASLQCHANPCRLWVVCMDQAVFDQLHLLELENLVPVRLGQLEDDALAQVREQRSWAEYCWTLTPFACRYVLAQDPRPARVTYVDADVAFFGPPATFIRELEQSRRTVLITDHAYAPEYASMEKIAGRFCVQFLTFSQESRSLEILHDWGAKCLEACSARPNASAGFGDQKYLEDWPDRFGTTVHVLRNTAQTLAPWNVDYFQKQDGCSYLPVMYHFHGLRILSRKYARLSSTYCIRRGGHIYAEYLKLLRQQCQLMISRGIELPVIPLQNESHWLLRTAKRFLFQHLVIRRHQLL
jgi:hypothetical protein